MNTRIKIVDSSGKIILNSLRGPEESAFVTGAVGIINLSSGKVRLGVSRSNSGEIFLASNEPDHLKSNRVFQTALELIASTAKYISSEVEAVEERAATRSRRLIHNLTSLNGHMIQELYSVVPQERLAGSGRRFLPNLMAEMRGPKAADFARCFFSIAKHSAAMKNEFSVFRKIASLDLATDKRNHYVHKVIMNVAYLFFSEFSDVNVFVSIAPSETKAWLDYECVFVALYHLFDNASKYVCHGTDVDVAVDTKDGFARITLDMQSLAIDPGTELTLMKEGYSGPAAIQLGLNGDGVGLGLVLKVMEMHAGHFIITPDASTRYSVDGVTYQRNRFSLLFPEMKK